MKNSTALAALAVLAVCGELPAEQTAERAGIADTEPADVTTVTNRIDDTVVTADGSFDANMLDRRTDAPQQRADAIETRTDTLAKAHHGTGEYRRLTNRASARHRL